MLADRETVRNGFAGLTDAASRPPVATFRMDSETVTVTASRRIRPCRSGWVIVGLAPSFWRVVLCGLRTSRFFTWATEATGRRVPAAAESEGSTDSRQTRRPESARWADTTTSFGLRHVNDRVAVVGLTQARRSRGRSDNKGLGARGNRRCGQVAGWSSLARSGPPRARLKVRTKAPPLIESEFRGRGRG